MKYILISTLSKRYSITKHTIHEVCTPFYFLEQVFRLNEEDSSIRCNENKFWSPENDENRIQLIHDIANAGRGVGGRFSILNRYEHGDRYGIEQKERLCKVHFSEVKNYE